MFTKLRNYLLTQDYESSNVFAIRRLKYLKYIFFEKSLILNWSPDTISADFTLHKDFAIKSENMYLYLK